MATRNPGSAVVPYQEPTEEADQSPRDTDKPSESMKRWIFPGFLLVAVIITWVVLFAVGMAGGPFGKLSFPLKLAVIVTVFHTVILAWPTFLLIRKRAWSRLIVVAVMLGGIWLTLVFGYTVAVGGAMWGLRFLGALALVLSAAAAYVLTRYPKQDQALVHELDLLSGLDQSVAEQQKVANRSSAVAQEVHAQLQVSENDLSNAVSVAEKSSKEFTKAQKAFDNNDLVERKATLESELAKANATLVDIPKLQVTLSQTIDKAKSRSAESLALQQQFEKLDEDYKVLVEETIPDLKRKLADVTSEVEVSDVKRALDQAAKANEHDAGVADEARREKNATSKRYKKATKEWKVQQGALTRLTEQRDDILTKWRVADETRRLQWRDGIALALFFAVVALLLGYPAWYGWVELEVF